MKPRCPKCGQEVDIQEETCALCGWVVQSDQAELPKRLHNAFWMRALSHSTIACTIFCSGALWAALLVPRIFSKSGGGPNKTASDISTLRSQVEVYKVDVRRFPKVLEDLRTQPPDAPGWREPYLDSEPPTDPWGNQYDYQILPSGREFSIISYGRDGIPGGEGADADIGQSVDDD